MNKFSSLSPFFYTIGALFLALLALLFGVIVSYNPEPQFSYTEPPIATESSSLDQANCAGLTEDETQTCCSAWASDNELAIPMCVGSWSWSELAGCQFVCTTE